MGKKNVRELRAERADILEKAQAIHEKGAEERKLTDEQRTEFDSLMEQVDQLDEQIEYLESGERVSGLVAALENRKAPAVNKIGLGDTEERALAHFIRTGDDGGLQELRASNDTTMNITTAADGGNAVPTGHFQGIVARRDESRLSAVLGVRDIPGKGTTVNVPVDNEADGEFVSTGESVEYDRDAPALDVVQMTLGKYTKKVDLTVELLEDEDSKLLAFIENFIGRGMAKTHNSLLLTEVAANGTSLKTFASATAIAAGEPEDILGDDDLGAYLDDTGSVSWVMRNSTFWDLASITGNARLYAETPGGSAFQREILGYPVKMSNKASAIAASAKSLYFGNWYFVGLREAPSFTMIRDPFTRADYGEVRLNYMFRAVYKVLQAEAIGYGEHPTG